MALIVNVAALKAYYAKRRHMTPAERERDDARNRELARLLKLKRALDRGDIVGGLIDALPKP